MACELDDKTLPVWILLMSGMATTPGVVTAIVSAELML